MTKNELLDKLAEKYYDWLNMAKSFKLSDENSKELVQEMFVRIFDYVKDPNKIMYNETEVNTFYIYVTLRNLYYAKLNKNNRTVNIDDHIPSLEKFYYCEEDFGEEDRKEYLEKIFNNVDSIMDSWYWYDRKMFELYYRTDMSMRDISSETNITLSSIFNTLSNAKAQIRQKLEEDYKEYKNKK